MLKFRVWDKEEESYIEGLDSMPCMRLADGAIHCVEKIRAPDYQIIGLSESASKYGRGALVLEQYIGLNDITGREIFVGDIVQYCHPTLSNHSLDGVNFEVKAVNIRGPTGIISFIFQSEDDILFNLNDGTENDRYSRLKIVGNIHEGIKS